jgi:hypothetical protein
VAGVVGGYSHVHGRVVRHSGRRSPGHDHQVAEVEREIGMTISPSVHEWADYAADLKRAGVFERAMRDYLVLEWDPDIDALRSLSIAEGNVDWVIQRGTWDTRIRR